MNKSICPHLAESVTSFSDISKLLITKPEICCTDCECQDPNLWLCLKKGCTHIGCSDKSNDHSTLHNAMDQSHCIHMNLANHRVWCYECKREVYLDQDRQSYVKDYESDQEDANSVKLTRDSGLGSYATLRTNSPDRGAIFENSVGLNVVMSGDGDASDSSDIGECGDYNNGNDSRGLVGLLNIGNTCYMNAALQALSNTEPLTHYFIDCANVVHILSEGRKPGLSRTYQALIREMWMKKNPQRCVTPSGILYGIRNVHAMFRGYHQHDTQEFLRNFMDQLHEELKQPLAPEIAIQNDSDTFSLAMEEVQSAALTYDSSEGEYETCDSGVSERSSLSDDSEAQQQIGAKSTVGSSKRRLSRCQSPGRRQRARVTSTQNVIDSQPTHTSQNHVAKKQIKYRSIISDIFDGKLLSSVQCLTCDRVSSRVETFQDLSLPIPSRDHLVLLHGRTVSPNVTCSDVVVPVQDGWISWILAWLRFVPHCASAMCRLHLSDISNFRSWWYGPVVTLHDCLSAFFSTDELKGDNMYSCEKCNKLRNGIKFSKVLQLPEVLCIHLKRFRHELMYSSKISSSVSFPLKGLDMWPYLHVNNTSKVSNYELFSVICHHGTAGGGHYTSFALNGGQWYEFDDQYVTKVSAEKVQNCEAYVLFYRKVQTGAESVRLKANKIAEEAERTGTDIRRSLISRQWITKFNYCVEPGPIDNSDFLCHHGSVDPDRELLLDQLAIEIPWELYDYFYKRFGGCPPLGDPPVICPACSALQQRILNEMETFMDINRKIPTERWPNTHYLSKSWYLQWHSFVQRKSLEPPGPVDNSKIDRDNLDPEEAAEVPQVIWDFFHGIYGGGPVLLINETESLNAVVESENAEPESLDDTIKASEESDCPELDGSGDVDVAGSETVTEEEEVAKPKSTTQSTGKKGSRYRRRNH